MKKVFVFILILLVFIPLCWLLVTKFEGKKPVVDIELPSLYLKKSYEISLKIEDVQTGLRRVMVSIMQNGNEKILFEKNYESGSVLDFLSGIENSKDYFEIPVKSGQYGMTDGNAVIRVMVADNSWRGWNKGNVFYTEKNVVIDTIPPRIKVLTRRHYIEKGGSGLVIYKVYEDQIKTGVKVGNNFFPGHSGLFADKNIHAAFFALDHTQGPGTRLNLVALDQAGNETRRGFNHYIRDERFQTDILSVPSNFLNRKIPEFDLGTKENLFTASSNPLLEKYLYINRQIRQENYDKILTVSQSTVNRLYWKDRFLRMKGAKKAGYADRRIYKHKGKKVDRAVHLGVDLASTANAPVKAANSGRVILSEFIGIFGNTVIIDHGFGLCSLYSHLEHSIVNVGDEIQRGEQIGLTGETGLAGGDHLHFSMIIHNVFVNPDEWWDSAWINNNITSKIQDVRETTNP